MDEKPWCKILHIHAGAILVLIKILWTLCVVFAALHPGHWVYVSQCLQRLYHIFESGCFTGMIDAQETSVMHMKINWGQLGLTWLCQLQYFVLFLQLMRQYEQQCSNFLTSAEAAVCVVKSELQPWFETKFVCAQYSQKTLGIMVAVLAAVAAWSYMGLLNSAHRFLKWYLRIWLCVMSVTGLWFWLGNLELGEWKCCSIYPWNSRKTPA